MGHSMGGGAAILAASLEPQIDAVVTLAPAETNPSAITAAGTLGIPSLVFAGSNDCVTPASSNQLPMFTAFQSTCKTFVTITGGSHCQMANSNLLCSAGELSCQPQAAITRAQQHAILATLLPDWLHYYLNDSCEAGTAFDANLLAQEGFSFESNCTLCEVLGVSAAVLPGFSVYPNPFHSMLQLTAPNASTYQFTLYDLRLSQLLEKTFKTGTTIELPELQTGIYPYTIKQHGKVVHRGKLLRK